MTHVEAAYIASGMISTAIMAIIMPAAACSAAEEICYVSSNNWDVHGAAVFGFTAIWCNRYHDIT